LHALRHHKTAPEEPFRILEAIDPIWPLWLALSAEEAAEFVSHIMPHVLLLLAEGVDAVAITPAGPSSSTETVEIPSTSRDGPPPSAAQAVRSRLSSVVWFLSSLLEVIRQPGAQVIPRPLQRLESLQSINGRSSGAAASMELKDHDSGSLSSMGASTKSAGQAPAAASDSSTPLLIYGESGPAEVDRAWQAEAAAEAERRSVAVGAALRPWLTELIELLHRHLLLFSNPGSSMGARGGRFCRSTRRSSVLDVDCTAVDG
jgi:hypothetical protein